MGSNGLFRVTLYGYNPKYCRDIRVIPNIKAIINIRIVTNIIIITNVMIIYQSF